MVSKYENYPMFEVTSGGAGGSANGEVFYDWGKISTVAEELSGILETFKQNVETLYNDVNNLNNSWSGPSYDAFKTNCDKYKTNAIDPLINNISDWVVKLQELAAEAQGTSQTNAGLFGN